MNTKVARALVMSEPLAEADEKDTKEMPVGLFNCFEHQDDLQGHTPCFPLFCPMAILCSNDTIGKTYTTLYEEEAICGEMGPKGLCLCTSLIPLNCITIPGCGVTPLPSCIAYCCLSMWLRRKFVMKYNVDESLTCGTMLFYASFFPCSLFQVLRTARHFDVEREQPVPLPTTKPGRDPLPSKYAELV